MPQRKKHPHPLLLDDLDRYNELMNLSERNQKLFYRLIAGTILFIMLIYYYSYLIFIHRLSRRTHTDCLYTYG